MAMYLRLSLYLFLFSIISCNLNNHSKDYRLVPGQVIEFNLSETTNYSSKYISYYHNNEEEYLVNYNENDISIEFYDFTTKQLEYSLSLRENPLFQNNKFYGFFVHNLDSIFICIKYSNKITLVNIEGTVLQTWIIDDSIANTEKYYLHASLANNLYYNDNRIYVSQIPHVQDPLQIAKTKPEIIYDIRKNKIISNTGNFPKVYQKGEWWHIIGYSLSKVLNNNNQLVLSFPVNHNLYVYQNDSLIKVIEAKSKYLQDYNFPAFDNDYRKNVEYKKKYVTTLGRYYRLIYDDYRNLYYRIVLHPQEYKNKDGSTNSSSGMSWSIMVLDRNFNLLIENFFPAKQFDFYGILVIKEGLLVSNNHDSNKNLDPSKFSYTLFDLEKKNDKES